MGKLGKFICLFIVIDCIVFAALGIGEKVTKHKNESQRDKLLAEAQTKIVAICTNDSEELSADKVSNIRIWKNGLSDMADITFVDRNHMEEVMKEHMFQLSDWSSEEKSAEIGRALNANALITFIAKESQYGGYSSYSATAKIMNINTFETLEFECNLLTAEWDSVNTMGSGEGKKKMKLLKKILKMFN
jgi:hypothetical protein